jgi:hypothetical protein
MSKKGKTVRGYKLLTLEGMSLRGRPNIQYTSKWQQIPGNGAYVAITGNLYAGCENAHPDRSIVAEMECREPVGTNSPEGVQCFRWVRVRRWLRPPTSQEVMEAEHTERNLQHQLREKEQEIEKKCCDEMPYSRDAFYTVEHSLERKARKVSLELEKALDEKMDKANTEKELRALLTTHVDTLTAKRVKARRLLSMTKELMEERRKKVSERIEKLMEPHRKKCAQEQAKPFMKLMKGLKPAKIQKPKEVSNGTESTHHN